MEKQLSEHLKFIHDKDILHTDIRPANIVLFPKVGWQIIDFDCALLGGSTTTRIQKGSSRYDFSSARIQALGDKCENDAWYVVRDYSKEDDEEMLRRAMDSILSLL